MSNNYLRSFGLAILSFWLIFINTLIVYKNGLFSDMPFLEGTLTIATGLTLAYLQVVSWKYFSHKLKIKIIFE